MRSPLHNIYHSNSTASLEQRPKPSSVSASAQVHRCTALHSALLRSTTLSVAAHDVRSRCYMRCMRNVWLYSIVAEWTKRSALFPMMLWIDLVQQVVHAYFEYAVARGGSLYISLSYSVCQPFVYRTQWNNNIIISVLILIGNYSVIIIANQRIPCDHQLHIHTCCLYAGGNTFCLRQEHVQVCLGVQRDNLTTALSMRTQNRLPKY